MIAATGVRWALLASSVVALVLGLSTGAATAQIEIRGYKEYTATVVAISPPRLSLSSIEEMRRPGKMVQVSIIEVASGECDRSNIVAALNAVTKTFSGDYGDMPMANGGPREALDALNRFYQDRMEVDVGSSGNPCTGEGLKAKGYRALSKTRTVGSVEWVTWVKKIGEAERNYGTATASFTIVGVPSEAVFDTRKHTQKYRFRVEGGISYDVDNEPQRGEAKLQSRELQRVFKEKVRKNAADLGKWLNKTRYLLAKEDIEKIINTPAGQTLGFNKHLNFKWAGDQKSISVGILVVAGEIKAEVVTPLGND